jgi:hypothetical protein
LPARTGLNALAGGFDGWSQSAVRAADPGRSSGPLAEFRIPLPAVQADFQALSLRRKRRPDRRNSTADTTKEINHA